MSFRQEMFERRRAFLLFVPLVLLYFTSYFQRTALPGTIFDTLAADLHLNAARVATIGASFVYTYAVFQLISGMLVDRYCGTRVVAVGGVFFLAGIILFPLCSSFGMLCAARMLAGAGASSMYMTTGKTIALTRRTFVGNVSAF